MQTNVYKSYFMKVSEVNKRTKITQYIGNIGYTKLFSHSIATVRGWFQVVISSHTLTLHNVMCARLHTHQGRSQDFRVGGADSCACKFWPCPLMKWKGRSSNYHKERILTVASELESTFLTEFWDKVSLWLSSKLFFLG